MILRRAHSTLRLISQPDHAALAGRIMDRWLTRIFPGEPRRASVMRAIAQHDNGWRVVDAAPLLDPSTGRVLDFISAPAAVRQGVWPRGVARLADDPVAAALVAEHASQVYSRYRDDPDWRAFFDEVAALRDRHAARAELPPADLRRLYFFVRMGDLISLVFCNEWTDVQHLEDHTIEFAAPDRVIIQPDPFDGTSVPFEITAREMPDRPYADASEAAELFRAAPTLTLAGTAAGASREPDGPGGPCGP
jgi:hypothetical protein